MNGTQVKAGDDVALKHGDRIIMGNHNVFTVVHPETGKGAPSLDYYEAIREAQGEKMASLALAEEHAHTTEAEKQRLDHEMLEALPFASEANLIAEELQCPQRFEPIPGADRNKGVRRASIAGGAIQSPRSRHAVAGAG